MYSFRKIYLFICICTYISGGEVDSLYAAGKDINDSSQIINTYLNKKIEILIHDLPQSLQNKTCENVSLYLMEELGTKDYFFFKVGALNTPLELWTENNIHIDRVPSLEIDSKTYSQNSIYAPELKFFGLWSTTVDPTINIGGIYIGAEKLSHFLGSGYEYYQKYLQVLEETNSKEEAKFEAIWWGIELEASIIGTWAVDIFSYADLEANYQGFTFAKDLCTQDLLQYHSGRWEMTKQVDIRHYINPNWDEAYNPNSYTYSRQKRIKTNIENLNICSTCDWRSLEGRYKYYEDKYSMLLRNTWLDTSLSSAIMKVLKARPEHKEHLYYTIAQVYGLTWSYEDVDNFFGDKLRQMKSTSFESFCPL